MAYSNKSFTSCSDSLLRGSRRADLAQERRSAMLTVAEVRRAAAFCGMDLKMLLRAPGQRLKEVASSIACSTCEKRLVIEGDSRETRLKEEGRKETYKLRADGE